MTLIDESPAGSTAAATDRPSTGAALEVRVVLDVAIAEARIADAGARVMELRAAVAAEEASLLARPPLVDRDSPRTLRARMIAEGVAEELLSTTRAEIRQEERERRASVVERLGAAQQEVASRRVSLTAEVATYLQTSSPLVADSPVVAPDDTPDLPDDTLDVSDDVSDDRSDAPDTAEIADQPAPFDDDVDGDRKFATFWASTPEPGGRRAIEPVDALLPMMALVILLALVLVWFS